jgi:hypothetical protein
MALGIFDPNIDSLEDVLAIRAKAIQALKDGSTVTSWTSEGSSATSQFTMPTKVVLEETKYYLQTVDPDTYGKRITRTRAGFSNSF